MASSKYERVSAKDEDAPLASSAGSDDTSTLLTPDSDSDDDVVLGDLELEEGLELRPLNKDGQHMAGAEQDEESDEDVHDGSLAARQRRRRASAASFELYTPDEERRVLRKLDTHLVLFVALLYMLSFLDRSNIGNSKVAGMAADLNLSDNQWEWLLTSFYLAYIAFEWMTLCYKIFPPHIYIACCVCAWGVIASLQALVTGYPALVFLRVLLGIGEAAFVGIPFYLSFFFRRDELALRVGLFIAAAPLATAFAATLAYVITRFGDSIDIANWRLLFLIEGFPAVLVAVWTYHWIPDGPSSAWWLTPRERKIATLRMRKETAAGLSTKRTVQSDVPRHKRKFDWSAVRNTIKDPKAYLTAGMFMCCNIAFSSMPVFLPIIVSDMGYTSLQAQALSAPPYLVAFFAVIGTAFWSDRINSRSGPMLLHATMALLGYTAAIITGMAEARPILRYLTVFPIISGSFSCVTLVITWTINNQVSDESKGTGMAVLNVFGQMGPLIGMRIYPKSDAPFYVEGMRVCAVALTTVIVLAWFLRILLRQENSRRRQRNKGEWLYIT